MGERKVILDIKEYEELTRAQKMLSSGKSLVIKSGGGMGSFYYNTHYFTDNEIAEELHKEVERLKKDLEMQEKITSNTTRDLNFHRDTLYEVSYMGWWNFRKWKKRWKKNFNKNQ